ncbi:MAG: ATP synthase F0 subunit B [Clostridia bacterium]|nr:ATP synthase F0 subunit B [Clostridia bacterium]
MSLPLNINFGQILLHMFNLTLLFGGLYLLLYKPVKKFMDDRTEKYKALDDEANKKLTEADETKRQAEEKLSGVQAEISEMMTKARLEAENEAESIVKEAKDKKAKILRDAEEAALREKSRIINDAREEVAVLAVKAAEKVLMEKSAKPEKKNA